MTTSGSFEIVLGFVVGVALSVLPWILVGSHAMYTEFKVCEDRGMFLLRTTEDDEITLCYRPGTLLNHAEKLPCRVGGWDPGED